MSPQALAEDVHQALLPAIEQSFLAAVLIDAHDRVRFFNQAAERLWGYTRDEVLGQDMRMLLPAELRQGHGGYVAAHRKGGMPRVVGMNRDLLMERKDGQQVWAAFALSRVDMSDGIGYMVFAYDVTEQVMRQAQNRLLLMAVNHTDRAMLVLDGGHRIVQTNKAFTDMLGYDVSEVMGKVPSQFLVSPHAETDTLDRLRRWAGERICFQEDVLAVRKDGRDVWVKVSVSPVFGQEEHAQVDNVVVVLSDSTEERQIRDMERDVLAALTSSLSFQEVGEFLCRRVEGIAPGVLVQLKQIPDGCLRPWAAPGLQGKPSAPWLDKPLGDAADGVGAAVRLRRTVMTADIATDPLWRSCGDWATGLGLRACWTYPVMLRDGAVRGLLSFYFRQSRLPDSYLERVAEVSVRLCALAIEREDSRQDVARLVQFDTLTGLPGKMQLHGRLDELMADRPDGPFAVLSLDLDHFADVNHTLGHAVGDQVLVIMANRLARYLGASSLLCRIAGDQFAVVVPDCDMTRSASMADRLLRAVERPLDVDGHQLILSASLGISHYPQCGSDRDVLLSSAQNAMAKAKKAGGGRYQFFSTEMHRIARDRLLLGAALKRAVAGRGLYLQYQPQVRPDTGQLYGVEALARWNDPEYGEIPPGKFIGLAEDIGEIETLGRWALREACRQMAEWRALGLDIPTVSVNQSPFNFRSLDLPRYIAGILREFDLPGRCLTIEITESTMMSLTTEMRGMMDDIRALGVGLSVDDFGTGYSSLSNLANLPVTELKIDRSFVGQGLEERRVRALVEAVIGIGRSLGLTVVAEGVETEPQRAWLDGLQCPVVQGYLFGRPLLPQVLGQWVRDAAAGPKPRS